MSRRTRAGLSGFFLGGALIWALFLPLYGERGLTVDPRPPVVLLLVLLLLGFTGQMRWTLRPWLRWLLAVAIVLLALLQFVVSGGGADPRSPARSLFRFPPCAESARALSRCGGLARRLGDDRDSAWAGAAALAHRPRARCDRACRGTADDGGRLARRGSIGLLLIALPFAQPIDTGGSARRERGRRIAGWRAFAVLHGFDTRYAAALDAPQPPPGQLPGLKGKDVYLVFIESYGTVALDDPAYRRLLDPALKDFASTVEGAGYTLLSSRLVSPVFGGGSWLAHGTLASGIKLDQLANELLLERQRLTLPRYLAAAGYRTIEVMPGIKKPDPEAAFWGFDQALFRCRSRLCRAGIRLVQYSRSIHVAAIRGARVDAGA